MTMFQKLGAYSAAALMILCSFSGCCGGGGSLCPFAGGSCGAAPQVAAPVEGCSSCAQQTHSQPTYAQQGYSQPTAQGGVVSGGSGTSFSPSAGGSGTSSPAFGGGSGSR